MPKPLGKVALLGALAGIGITPSMAMAQGTEIKPDFNCRIELPESGETVFTYDSARVCAARYISVTCNREVEDPADEFTIPEVDCRIDPEPCGLDFPELEDDQGLLPATRATLKIDDQGLARLHCVFVVPSPP
jgi:hypothetical protein